MIKDLLLKNEKMTASPRGNSKLENRKAVLLVISHGKISMYFWIELDGTSCTHLYFLKLFPLATFLQIPFAIRLKHYNTIMEF